MKTPNTNAITNYSTNLLALPPLHTTGCNTILPTLHSTHIAPNHHPNQPEHKQLQKQPSYHSYKHLRAPSLSLSSLSLPPCTADPTQIFVHLTRRLHKPKKWPLTYCHCQPESSMRSILEPPPNFGNLSSLASSRKELPQRALIGDPASRWKSERKRATGKQRRERRVGCQRRERVGLPTTWEGKGMRDQIFTTPHLLYSPFKSNYCLPSWRGALMGPLFYRGIQPPRNPSPHPHCRAGAPQAYDLLLLSNPLFGRFGRTNPYIRSWKANKPAPKHKRQLTTWQVSVKQRGDFTCGNRTVDLFFEIWVSFLHHSVVWGRYGPCWMWKPLPPRNEYTWCFAPTFLDACPCHIWRSYGLDRQKLWAFYKVGVNKV